MISQIISDECLYNILGHIKSCWKYDYPTGGTLETAVYLGMKPFYSNAKQLGSPSTIVDVGKDDDAFDIKGCKVLGHVNKTVKSSNYDKNIFVKQTVPNFGEVHIRIPVSIITQVRRPKVDLKGYKGSAKKSLDEQIDDYQSFALRTTDKDGYQRLFSMVLLYGIDTKKGFKSAFLTLTEFDIPKIINYSIGKNAKGVPNSYQGLDENGNNVFVLSSFNKGSSNFYKRFGTSKGVLMTWPIEEENPFIYTKQLLEESTGITIIN